MKTVNLARMNPVKAYQLGRAEGEKESKALDIRLGIRLAESFLLLAAAYVNEKNDGTTYLSKPKFREFYLELEKTLDRFIEESIESEEGIDTYDIADLYVGHDSTVRERYGLPKGDYSKVIKYGGEDKEI